MALDSSTDYYFKFNGTRDQVNKSFENNNNLTTEMTKNNLNFYESMYHFKKMFPKFDSDVIETVLRANNGSVDRTIDQLLTMAADNEIIEMANDTRSTNNNSNQLASYDTTGLDLPPSYESLITSQITSNGTNNNNFINPQVDLNQTVHITMIDKNRAKSDKNETIIEDLISLNQYSVLSVNNPSKMENAADVSIGFEFDDTKQKHSLCSVNKNISDTKFKLVEPPKQPVKSLLGPGHCNILIGELNRDFLRIKLTTEQVKKIKTSIKKAKRNEIAAMLNNVNILMFFFHFFLFLISF
jgi:hypothetical protein